MKSGQEIWFVHNNTVHRGIIAGCTSTQLAVATQFTVQHIFLDEQTVFASEIEAVGRCIKEVETYLHTLDRREKKLEKEMDTRAKELYQLHLEDKK